VDVVVTDKKGNYVSDLALKDFKVWEDNKEQGLKTFQFGADPSAPANNKKRYMVLFFDNSSMDMGDQVRARQEAGKFIDKNAGPDRLMAIVNFSGSLQISQNFTDDAERLKQVVSGNRTSATSTQPVAIGGPGGLGGGLGRLGGAGGDFGVRTVLLSLRQLAKNLSDVPGRKTLVMFTSGFPFTPEIQPELTAAIDACNRANVAVYPIDVRGLVTPTQFPFGGPRGAVTGAPSGVQSAALLPAALRGLGIALAGDPLLRVASFLAEYVAEQGRGGGGTTSGGTTGGGTTGGGTTGGGAGAGGGGGGRGGATGGSPGGGTSGGGIGGAGGRGGASSTGFGNSGAPGGRSGTSGNTGGGGTNNAGRGGFNNGNVPFGRGRDIVPRFPESATTNQQVLYMLAEGTGGFVILNTNDLLGGLEKIGREQSEYYIVGYTPPDSKEGDCHVLRVKVNRSGTNWRARTGYCNSKSVDVLAGKPVERQLETQATGTEAGNIKAAMTTPYFYSSADTARVSVAIEMPAADIKFEKVKGKLHAELNVLGIAYRANANVAARFSDTVKIDFEDKKEVEKFAEKPYHYENQFDVASGQYTLKVAFSSGGESFGKLESPLNIDPYDGKMFMVSALALCSSFHKVAEVEANMDAALLEGRAPLVAMNFQFDPAGANRFKSTENVAIYFEVYDPKMLDEKPPGLQVQLKVLDRKGGPPKVDSGGVDANNFIRKGNAVVPIGLKLPVSGLTPGAYRIEITAMDSAGRTMVRSADFDVL
jgi:VWFA-related protein